MQNEIKDIVENIRQNKPVSYTDEQFPQIIFDLTCPYSYEKEYIIPSNTDGVIDKAGFIASFLNDYSVTLQRCNSIKIINKINKIDFTNVDESTMELLVKRVTAHYNFYNPKQKEVLLSIDVLKYIYAMSNMEEEVYRLFDLSKYENEKLENLLNNNEYFRERFLSEVYETPFDKYFMRPLHTERWANNPYLLAISLKERFSYTIRILKKDLGEEKTEQLMKALSQNKKFADITKQIIAKHIVDMNIRNADSYVNYLKYFPEAFLETLSSYPASTNSALNKVPESLLSKFLESFSEEQQKQMIEVLQKEGLASTIFNIHAKNKFYELGSTLEEIAENIKKGKFSVLDIPGAYAHDATLIGRISNNEIIGNFVEFLYNHKYTEESEKHLMKLLGKNCSLEEHIRSIKEKSRSELTLYDLYSIEYYGKKCLAKNGVDDNIIIDVFEYTNGSAAGEHSALDKKITVYNPLIDRSVKRMLHALHHEVAHGIQFHLLVKGTDFDIDDDIDLYCKDRILSSVLGREYYDGNYYDISYEFDAEYRAICMENELYGNEEEFNFKVEDLYNKSIKENSKNNENIKEIMYCKYNVMREHNGQEYDIDDLFVEVFNDSREQEEYLKKFPIIGYIYNIETKNLSGVAAKSSDFLGPKFVVSKRNVTQYIKLYLEADNEDKKIYLKLIENELSIERYGISNKLTEKFNDFAQICAKIDDENLNKIYENFVSQFKQATQRTTTSIKK